MNILLMGDFLGIIIILYNIIPFLYYYSNFCNTNSKTKVSLSIEKPIDDS